MVAVQVLVIELILAFILFVSLGGVWLIKDLAKEVRHLGQLFLAEQKRTDKILENHEERIKDLENGR